MPSSARLERCSELFLTDRVRTGIQALVTEAQHIEGSVVPGHRRQTGSQKQLVPAAAIRPRVFDCGRNAMQLQSPVTLPKVPHQEMVGWDHACEAITDLGRESRHDR